MIIVSKVRLYIDNMFYEKVTALLIEKRNFFLLFVALIFPARQRAWTNIEKMLYRITGSAFRSVSPQRSFTL